MKRNKLYTANRWNQPVFIPDRNLFPDGGSTNPFGINLSAPTIPHYVNWSDPVQRARALGQTQSLVNNFATQAQGIIGASANQQAANFAPKENAVSNPFSFKDAFSKEGFQNGLKAGAGAAIGGLSSAVGQIGGNLISGGLSSGAGSAISSIGSTVGGAISAVNPLVGAAVGLGSQLLGGVTNALWGTKVDQAKLDNANQGTNMLNNFNSAASSFDDVQGPQAVEAVGDAYSGGVFKKGWARRKNQALKEARADAMAQARRSVENNIDNLTDDQMNNLFSGWYALGGDLQTHGGDWTTGLTHIDAGLSHEENPNEGVQMGVDNEGTPNLVEEGETVWNDYVFSNRILADEATKQMFKLPKKKDVSFADISKKLEREIQERPNDPISKSGFNAQMQVLEEQQERQKQEMEAERAKAAFEALSPEDQTALMQQKAEQEAIAQQVAEEQAIAEQQAMQVPLSEEGAMMQQPQMADGSEAALGQESQIAANGGKINRFDLGGKAYTRMVNSLGFHTQKEFDDWAKENNIDLSKIWSSDDRTLNNDILSNLWKDDNFKKALKAKNPALAHAFSEKGYDWGAYQPTGNGKATIQSISKGNWKTTTGKGWRGSEDLAFKQATEGLSDAEIDALTTEQLAERMRKTPAYQNTNKWLQNSDNALQYLNTLLNDPDTPEVAREYARKFVKDGKWKDGFNYNYATVFGSNGGGVRETNPGTYWHTVLEANRGNQASNFVINDDGTIEPIVGDVPTDWASAGNYTWSDEDNDYAYNYYRRPAPSTSTTVEATNGTEAGSSQPGTSSSSSTNSPRHKWGNLRYAGLFGPAIGLGLQAAGVGRPDTASLDAAISGSGDVSLAKYHPIGNYLAYRPLDIWYEQNRLNANSRATDRNLMNTSGGNRGTAMAGILANGYNDQIASGNLFRQAQEYNDALRQRVEEFNRGTDQFNAEAYTRNSQFNADARNRARQFNNQLRLTAAREKMDADAGWYNGIYGNVSGLFKGLGDIGRENEQFNWLSDLAADGYFGNLGKSNTGRRWAKQGTKAKGGKINGKKGLTI